MTFMMLGTRVKAIANVIVEEWHQDAKERMIWLVNENKRPDAGPASPISQLVAQAIAAYSNNLKNNAARHRNAPLPLQQTIPAFTMVGSTIQFYKVTVTQNLINFLEGEAALSDQEENHTIVEQLSLHEAELQDYEQESMRPLQNRRFVLRCFDALRGLMGNLDGSYEGGIYNGPPEPVAEPET